MMTVSRNVVRDLLPVYLAGEASKETKALVEEFLKSDHELANEVAQAQDLRLPDTQKHPTSEKETLDSTRRLLKYRTSTMAVALIFTVLPFSFVFKGSHITFFLIRDAPAVGIAWWVTAAIMWICHAVIRYRLRVSGL
jgi:predicted anti-sigma-YlaC factor YlaD